MDFSLTPEQELLRQSARDVLAATMPPPIVRELMRGPDRVRRDHWPRLAELGWLGLILPETYGGVGLSMVELAIVMHEAGRAVLPGPFLATVAAGVAILRCGSDAQRQRWLPGIGDGTLAASLAVPEVGGSWALEDIAAMARRDGGSYVLSGVKRFVLDGAGADVVAAVVRVPDADAPDGAQLGLVVVERDRLSEVTALETVDETRAMADVRLDDVRVERDDVMVAKREALDAVLDHGRVAVAAEMCGGAERVLELTVEYAKVRRQFDQPIGAFQAIQHRCADMSVAVECAKAATDYAAWALATSAADAPVAAARAKALATDAYRDVTLQSVQVHGGIGFTWEHDLHLYFKRALSTATLFGDATFNRELVARRLGL